MNRPTAISRQSARIAACARRLRPAERTMRLRCDAASMDAPRKRRYARSARIHSCRFSLDTQWTAACREPASIASDPERAPQPAGTSLASLRVLRRHPATSRCVATLLSRSPAMLSRWRTALRAGAGPRPIDCRSADRSTASAGRSTAWQVKYRMTVSKFFRRSSTPPIVSVARPPRQVRRDRDTPQTTSRAKPRELR